MLETGGWGQNVTAFQKNGRVNTSDPRTTYTWYGKHLPDMGTTFWLLNEEKWDACCLNSNGYDRQHGGLFACTMHHSYKGMATTRRDTIF
jgi:hypothetical protein